MILERAPRDSDEIRKPSQATQLTDGHARNPGLTVEVITDPELIVQYEAARVRWYLKKWPKYVELKYDSIIRLPTGIDPLRENITDEEIRAAVQTDFDADHAEYEAYARLFEEKWQTISEKVLPMMAQVYGVPPSGHFEVMATGYGTGGGALETGGVVFFKLPKYRLQSVRRTEEEAITHEILNHEATAALRAGTAIDDSINTSHQWHKERLMDLLGRTLLVRSGLMRRGDIIMDDYAEAQAATVIDPLYYGDVKHPKETDLRYEGRLLELIQAIEVNLKLVPPVTK